MKGKFRKLPVEIEAERIHIPRTILTDEGTMVARSGDWVITGVEGERYPCRDSVFRQTYSPADEKAHLIWHTPLSMLDELEGYRDGEGSDTGAGDEI